MTDAVLPPSPDDVDLSPPSSAAPLGSQEPQEVAAEAKPSGKPKKRYGLVNALGSASAIIMALIVAFLAVLLVVRLGAVTPTGLSLVERSLNGLRVDRSGWLVVSGLRGDPFGKFSAERVAIRDAQGEWIEARNVRGEWSPGYLALRKVRVDTATADGVVMTRRPVLLPKPLRHRESPVSVEILDIRTIAITEPAVSVVRGEFDVVGTFDLVPKMGTRTRVDVRSRGPTQDFATGLVRARRDEPVFVDVRARGAQGGALAGLVGLDPSLPFAFDLTVSDKDHVSKITLLATSGTNQIADLTGSLTPEGGAVQGQVRLDASRLTQGLASRVGPSVFVDATMGRRDTAGRQNLVATLEGERANLRLNGPVRRAETWVAEGLGASLDVADLGALAQNPQLAGMSLSLDGRVAGSLENLAFDGAVEATSLAVGDYRIGVISGPLSFTRQPSGGISISANLVGAGAAGGLLGQWLGQAPRFNGQIRQFPNGEWALEQGTLTGVGITANGSGGRDLFGRVRSSGSAVLDAGRSGVPQASGRLPIDWSVVSRDGGLFDVTAKGVGRGFSIGNAWLDNILGPAPTFDVALVLGGPSLVFERLKVNAAKLRIDGNGQTQRQGQGPVGFLLSGRFDGDLSALGLDRLSGHLAGRFTAQPARGGGIQIGFNGQSNRFAASLGPLDELVGTKPDLSGTVISRPGIVLLSDVRIAGTKLRAETSGQINLDRNLALSMDWSAQGPIQLGPLEIAGSPSGSGTITGPIAEPVLTVSAALQSLNLPQVALTPARFGLVLPLTGGAIGTATLSGETQYGAINARAKVVPSETTLTLNELAVEGAGVSLSGDLAIQNQGNVSGQFSVNATPGLVVASGALRGQLAVNAGASGEPDVRLSLSGTNVAMRASPDLVFSSLSVSGNGKLSQLPLSVRAVTAGPNGAAFSGSVLVSNSDRGGLTLSASGTGQAIGLSFTTATPLRVAINGPQTAISGNVRFSAGNRVPSGYIDLDLSRNNDQLTGAIEAQNVSLALLNPDLTGQVSARVSLDGRGDQLRGTLSAQLDRALSRGLPADLALSGGLRGRIDNGRLIVEGDLANARGLTLSVENTFPVEASASPLRLALVRNAPISGEFRASGEVRPLADLVFAGERTLNGPVEAQGTISGTFNAPRLAGNVRLTKGEWLEPRIGLRMTDLELDAELAGDEVIVQQLRARDGAQGRMEGSGRIQLAGAAPSTFRAELRRFRLFDIETGQASANGTVQIERYSDGRAELLGRLQVENAEFRPVRATPTGAIALDVVEINRPEPSATASNDTPVITLPRLASAPGAPAIRLNVELVAPRGVFVRGRGLNLELNLDARVTGTTSRPVLTGEATVFRGAYTYGGRVFDFQEGGTITLAANPENIRLNLVAVRDADDLDARIVVAGTAVDPRITLTSNPPLPQDEVLSRVLFGRSTAQLTGVEALQLAAGLAALAGGDNFDVIGNLRDLVALDRLTFAYGAAGLEVTGGKYLGRDFYLELINEPDVGIISQVEWRPIRPLAITSRLAPDGDARISIRWRQSINRD